MASVLKHKRTLVAIATGAVVLAVLCFAAAASPSTTAKIRCSYVEAGAPGPAGNVLRIEDESNSSTHVHRQGDEIVVFSNAESEATACTGGTPTVFNIDQIEYQTTNSAPFFDYIGGKPLAPAPLRSRTARRSRSWSRTTTNRRC